MEILFVHIKKWRNIENQSFNFNSNYHFEYSDEMGVLKLKSKNTQLPVNFYPSRISNVSAIVGENGVGKSNFLEFLSFWVGNPFIDHFVIFRTTNGTLKSSGNIIFGYENEKGKREEITKLQEDFVHQTILINSSFSHSKYPIIPYKLNLTQRGIFDRGESRSEKKTWELNDLDFFYFEEFKLQLNFVRSDCEFEYKELLNHVQFGFSIMNITLRPKNEDQKELYLLRNSYHERYNELKKLANRFPILKRMTGRAYADNVISKEFLNVVFTFYNFLYLVYNNDDYDRVIDHEFFASNEYTTEDFIGELYDDVKELYFDQNTEKFALWRSLNEAFLDLINSNKITYVERDFSLGPDFIRTLESAVFQLVGHESIEKLFSHIENTFAYPRFMWFRWGISAGQSALLNQFSKLYNVFSGRVVAAQAVTKEYPVTICCDELDSFLHPQWSKDLVSFYLKYLPEIIEKTGYKKHVQLIFTTHSPFMLSDFPRSNVLYLSNNKSKPVEETFAANVHNILSHSFYMSNGMIGEFSKGKINDVIWWINAKLNERKSVSGMDIEFDEDHEKHLQLFTDTKQVLKVINLVGDQLIKRKLLSMFYELEPEYISKKAKIESLYQQLIELGEDIKLDDID